ncbi:hypothetical protein HYW76_05565 [Candidatus Pacearchaeota archaeon]|nr:hypothetical protein [Candidatus Pacearchaeota archaeon]
MNLFIFGSTGDLVKRKVLPALGSFEDLRIFAFGRKDWSTGEYVNLFCNNSCEKIKNSLIYCKIDYNNLENNHDLIKFLDKKINYFYCSLPPNMIINILRYFSFVKNKGYNVKLLIEKPFGSSLDEARALKKFIIDNNLEGHIFLADHYLFKNNMLSLKNTSFKKMSLVSLETLGIEGRIHYDNIGALKDMVQSHFINILLKLMSPNEIASLKVKSFVKKQYAGYLEETGGHSNTETYVKIILEGNEKTIILETGKKFEKKVSYLDLDGVCFNLDEGDNPYISMFKDFFDLKVDRFPTIDNALFSWKFIEEIDKHGIHSKL